MAKIHSRHPNIRFEHISRGNVRYGKAWPAESLQQVESPSETWHSVKFLRDLLWQLYQMELNAG